MLQNTAQIRTLQSFVAFILQIVLPSAVSRGRILIDSVQCVPVIAQPLESRVDFANVQKTRANLSGDDGNEENAVGIEGNLVAMNDRFGVHHIRTRRERVAEGTCSRREDR